MSEDNYMQITRHVISAYQFDFEDSQTKRKVVGTKVLCYDPSSSVSQKGFKGVNVVEYILPFEFFDSFTIVPGDYKILTTLVSKKINGKNIEVSAPKKFLHIPPQQAQVQKTAS